MSVDSSLRGYRFQLRPRSAQAAQLGRYAGMMRWIWNRALAEQQARRERGEKHAGYASMCAWLTAWRNAAETSWLREGPVHPQQCSTPQQESSSSKRKRVPMGQGGEDVNLP